MLLGDASPNSNTTRDGTNIKAPNLSYAAQYLACALTCERFTSALADIRASLGAGAVRCSFTVTDFHRLPLAGLPAHPSANESALQTSLERLTEADILIVEDVPPQGAPPLGLPRGDRKSLIDIARVFGERLSRDGLLTMACLFAQTPN
jgi:hypothetical protein